MPGKAGAWENAEFLMELSLALFQIANNGGALSLQAKSAIEAYLKSQGYDQSWESVRLCSSLCLQTELFLPLPSSNILYSSLRLFGSVSCPIIFAIKQIVLRLVILPLSFPLFRSSCFLAQALAVVVMGRSQMRWDANAHEDMLICMVKHCDLTSQNMAKVLADMQKKGYEFTENAFRQHIQKLRKARDTSALDGSGNGSKPTTPQKPTPRKTPTSGRKRKVNPDEDEDELGRDLKFEDEDEDDTKVTPSKRVKNESSSENADWKKSIFKAGEF
ncbi:hypothetical protein PWT90_10035 [Aphanocladium album]|nr:hypothetical protein PWT90_10035 [Aphanocladium album]